MLLTPSEPVLSRHRLPQPYRALLTLLWALPAAGLAVLVLMRGHVPDLRALGMIGLLLLPACYVWREGVDVLPGAIVRRIHVTRRYRNALLRRVEFDEKNGVLRVWDEQGRIALECRHGHLTAFETLCEALKSRARDSADAK